MKRKLLFAALCACAWVSSYAVEWTDKTLLITNPSFETDDAIADLKNCGWATDRVTGWTIAPSSASNAQIGVGNSSSTLQGIGSKFNPSEGDKFFYTRNNWNANTTFTLSQTISAGSIPAGLYKVTCKTATYSDNAAFNTLTLSLKEGNNTPVANSGIVMNVWNTWGVILFKQADDTDLTITMTFKPGYDGSNKHYAVVLDDFHLEFIAAADAYNASADNTIDFSAFINNAGIYNHSTKGNCPRGWTSSKHTTGNGNYTEGEKVDTRLEGWSGSNLDIDYNQTITNLPAGTYTVTAAAQERAKVGRTYVYASTEGQDEATGLVDNTPEYDVTTSALKVTNGTMKIGIKSTANDWVTADNFRISFLGFDVDAVKGNYETKFAEAEAARDNTTDYVNIVGEERTNLVNAITTYTTSETQSYGWYLSAINALETAISNFTAAKTNYDALAAEIVKATALGMDASSYAATSSSTAETALSSTQSLKVAEYTHINTTYAESATLGTWTETFAEDLNGEGYVSGGDTYWNEWGSATRTGKQTVSLPAGDYAISCIARGAVGTSGYLYYKIGDADAVTTAFNMKGNRGRGVDTYGAANFSGEGTYTCSNEGFGWEYNFLTFHLDAAASVEIGVSATFASNWVSIYAPNLFTTEASVKTLRLEEITTALSNIPSGKMNATVQETLEEKVAAAEGASDANTKDQLNTIASELNAAIEAANNSIAAYAEVNAAIEAAEAVALVGSSLDISTQKTAYNKATMLDSDKDATIAAIKAALTTALFEQTLVADVTALLTNPSFENGTKGWNAQFSATAGRSWGAEENAEAKDGDYVVTMSTANGWFTGFAIDQPVTLPPGYYKLTADVKSTNVEVDTYIFASTNTTWSGKDMPTLGTAKVSTADTWENLETIFYVDAEKTVYLGVTTESGNWDGATYANYKADNFKLYYLGDAAANMKIAARKYGTFIAQFDVTIPAGVTASTVTGVEGFILTLEEVETTIPANTPVIVTRDDNAAVDEIFYGRSTATKDSYTEGLLTGVYTTDKIPAGNNYVLQTKNGKQGFYKVGEDGFTATPNRCYLTVEGSSSVKAFFFDDGETAIQELVNGESVKGQWYNLSGQRVNKAQKGIYIINGKKVVK